VLATLESRSSFTNTDIPYAEPLRTSGTNLLHCIHTDPLLQDFAATVSVEQILQGPQLAIHQWIKSTSVQIKALLTATQCRAQMQTQNITNS